MHYFSQLLYITVAMCDVCSEVGQAGLSKKIVIALLCLYFTIIRNIWMLTVTPLIITEVQRQMYLISFPFLSL